MTLEDESKEGGAGVGAGGEGAGKKGWEDDGRTALHIAILSLKAETVRTLLLGGASPNVAGTRAVA